MIFTPTRFEGCFIIELTPFTDERGWFARTYCKNEFSQAGHNVEWVQMNHSFTARKGSLRGMHYQLAPAKEIKMVRCIAGAVFDAVVDIRKDSPTFLQWMGIELSAENRKMIYIPEGFAHGFQTLTDNCELLYQHSGFYTPGLEGGIRYNDPAIAINWPLPVVDISGRDAQHSWLDADFKGI